MTGVNTMSQLNIHLPETSDLLARVEQCARELGTSPSSLARVVLDIGLEPYVSAQREARRYDRDRRSVVTQELRQRFSGALPARRLTEDDIGDVVTPHADTTGAHH